MLKIKISKFLSLFRPIVFFSKCYELSIKSLGLSRVCLGFCLFYGLLVTAFEIPSFYTDQSAIPRFAIRTLNNNDLIFSFNMLSGELWFQVLLFSIAILSSCFLILGFYTRISCFFCWALFLSIHNRATIIFDGGDDAMKLFLLCFCFLPVSRCFSVDSKLNNRLTYRPSIPASLLLIIQIGSIYFFSALLKSSERWFPQGSALYYTLELDTFTSYYGKLLLFFPNMLKFATLFVWCAEFILPPLLLLPFFHKQIRYLFVITFFLFHLGIILFMDIGLFPYTMISALVALLPGGFWQFKFMRDFEITLESYFSSIANFISSRINLYKFTTKPTFGSSKIASIFCIFIIFYITAWNLRTTDFVKYEKYFKREYNWIGNCIGIGQYWPLFAPYPMTQGGWYMFVGFNKDGQEINILEKSKPVYERPFSTSNTYKNFRWKKYLINLWGKNYSEHRKNLASYLCNSWNTTHQDKIFTLNIYYMLENVLPPENIQHKTKPSKVLTWSESCSL